MLLLLYTAVYESGIIILFINLSKNHNLYGKIIFKGMFMFMTSEESMFSVLTLDVL